MQLFPQKIILHHILKLLGSLKLFSFMLIKFEKESERKSHPPFQIILRLLFHLIHLIHQKVDRQNFSYLFLFFR